MRDRETPLPAARPAAKSGRTPDAAIGITTGQARWMIAA